MVLLPFPIQQDFGTWSRFGEQPTPPTPPTKRKRKQVQYAPKWAVGNRVAVRDFEKFGGVATTVTIEQVIIQLPHIDKRRFRITEATALYVARYRDGSVLIVNEASLSAMAGYAEKQNARAVGSSTSVFTSTCAARQTGNPDAA